MVGSAFVCAFVHLCVCVRACVCVSVGDVIYTLIRWALIRVVCKNSEVSEAELWRQNQLQLCGNVKANLKKKNLIPGPPPRRQQQQPLAHFCLLSFVDDKKQKRNLIKVIISLLKADESRVKAITSRPQKFRCSIVRLFDCLVDWLFNCSVVKFFGCWLINYSGVKLFNCLVVKLIGC